MVTQTLDTYGKIDILVNNAALFADLKQGSFLDIDEAEWDRVMQINTRGVFNCTKAVVPEMKKNGYGKIVNIASGTVFQGHSNAFALCPVRRAPKSHLLVHLRAR